MPRARGGGPLPFPARCPVPGGHHVILGLGDWGSGEARVRFGLSWHCLQSLAGSPWSDRGCAWALCLASLAQPAVLGCVMSSNPGPRSWAPRAGVAHPTGPDTYRLPQAWRSVWGPAGRWLTRFSGPDESRRLGGPGARWAATKSHGRRMAGVPSPEAVVWAGEGRPAPRLPRRPVASLPLRVERAGLSSPRGEQTAGRRSRQPPGVSSAHVCRWSSAVALSCQGPVAQSPVSQLSSLMSVLSLVAREAGRSKRPEGPSPLRAAGKEPAWHVLTSAAVSGGGKDRGSCRCPRPGVRVSGRGARDGSFQAELGGESVLRLGGTAGQFGRAATPPKGQRAADLLGGRTCRLCPVAVTSGCALFSSPARRPVTCRRPAGRGRGQGGEAGPAWVQRPPADPGP